MPLFAIISPMKIISLFFLLLLNFNLLAETPQQVFLDQHYGDHERQIFDLWLPEKTKHAPLVIYIHGGGFSTGSKDEMRKKTSLIEKYNKAGIAFATINYRYLVHTSLQNIMHEDIAGFVQFMRFNSKKFGLNKKLMMPYGISAGGSASLWLATHDDIADPNALNLMKRESSRVFAAGHLNAQVSYDYMVWYEFFGKENTDKFIGSDVWGRYGFASFDDLFTELGIRTRQDMNMYGNMTADDCPILFWNNLDENDALDGNHFVHSPKHARFLSEKAKSLKLKAEVLIKADGTGSNDPHGATLNFFLQRLKEK